MKGLHRDGKDQDGEEERLKIKKHSFKGTDSMYGKAGHKGGAQHSNLRGHAVQSAQNGVMLYKMQCTEWSKEQIKIPTNVILCTQ